MGINACPGRNIAYATLGLLAGFLIKKRLQPDLLTQPQFDTQVTLLQNFQLRLIPEVQSKLNKTKICRNYQNSLWQNISINELTSLSAGMITAIFTFYLTENSFVSMTIGILSALLCFRVLQHIVDKAEPDSPCYPNRKN